MSDIKDDVQTSTPISQKIILVGFHGCGKTALLLRYFLRRDPTKNYILNCLDNMKTDVSVFGRSVVLNIWDFHLQDGFNIRYSDKMRDTVVAIICFGIDSGSSLLTAEHKWADEVKEYTTAPIILVGCKSDTRQALEGIQGRKKVVSTEEGKALAERIGAEIYLECSAVTGEGIDEVFYHAARLSLRPAPKLKTKESKDGCVVF